MILWQFYVGFKYKKCITFDNFPSSLGQRWDSKDVINIMKNFSPVRYFIVR